MKDFKITTDQINTILSVLGEFPAKNVIGAVDLLRSLPELVKEEEK